MHIAYTLTHLFGRSSFFIIVFGCCARWLVHIHDTRTVRNDNRIFSSRFVTRSCFVLSRAVVCACILRPQYILLVRRWFCDEQQKCTSSNLYLPAVTIRIYVHVPGTLVAAWSHWWLVILLIMTKNHAIIFMMTRYYDIKTLFITAMQDVFSFDAISDTQTLFVAIIIFLHLPKRTIFN